MGDTIAQTRFENVSKHSNDSLLARGFLKRRVKKLEKKNRSRTHKLKRLYKVGLRARVESSDDEESLEVDEEVVEVINPAKLIIDAAQVSAAGDKVSAASAAITISA
ncbi:hypothetical protein Tco_0193326, partial [Tanacetum coccineum]